MKDFLRNRRKELGLDVNGMAELLGVSIKTIYQYETEKRFPHATQLISVAKAYQLTNEELILWLKYINEEK